MIGLSGGATISFLAKKVVDLGLKPLAIHFGSGWNSEMSVNNIETIVKSLELDLSGYPSGVYKAVVSNSTYQNTVKFSVGLSYGSGAITFSSTKLVYSPGESILILGATGANSILNIFLIDPNGEIINKIEIFADKEGVFTTEMLGIPYSAISGVWQLKAQSGLDHKEVEINVITNSS